MTGAPPREKARLGDSLVLFCRLLRERGLLVAAEETADAHRALSLVDIGDRSEVKLALRVLLASSVSDLSTFDMLFDEFWSAVPGAPSFPGPRVPQRPKKAGRQPSSFSMEGWLRAFSGDLETVETKSASTSDAHGTLAVSPFGRDETREVERIAAQLARRLANRRGRRWQTTTRGPRVDLRRSMRASLATGGDLAQLVRRSRRRRKVRIVAACDVSGSMDLYSRFFLQFLHALQRSAAHVESFVFAARLTRVTHHLAAGRLNDALEPMALDVRDWSSGTRIGASLGELAVRWQRLLDRHTLVVILSDGWDTGEPELLDAALTSIRQRVDQVIWLNPLLGNPGYRPATIGLLTAMPHVDVFAPLHDIASLRQLSRLLGS